MNISIKLLKKLKVCPIAITRYTNTPSLHEVDFDNINTLVVGDLNLFEDINFLIKTLKGRIKLEKLIYKYSDSYTSEYQYDFANNTIFYSDSSGRSVTKQYNKKWKLLSDTGLNPDYNSKYTYNKKGQCLTFCDSEGFSIKYTYDKNSNLLLNSIDSKGITVEYTYDINGNEICYKRSDGFIAEKTYNENNILTGYKDSTGYINNNIVGLFENNDNIIKEYDLTLFEIN